MNGEASRGRNNHSTKAILIQNELELGPQPVGGNTQAESMPHRALSVTTPPHCSALHCGVDSVSIFPGPR